MSGDRDRVRSFDEMRDTGLLWLINASVLHPRGFALAFHYGNGQDAEPTGWSIVYDGTEPVHFGDGRPNGESPDDAFRAVNELLQVVS